MTITITTTTTIIITITMTITIIPMLIILILILIQILILILILIILLLMIIIKVCYIIRINQYYCFTGIFCTFNLFIYYWFQIWIHLSYSWGHPSFYAFSGDINSLYFTKFGLFILDGNLYIGISYLEFSFTNICFLAF